MLLARLLPIAIFLSGCSLFLDDGDDGDGDVPPQEPVEGTFEVNRKVDLLFVIDDSGSMLDEQINLTNAFPQFTTALQQITGGMPDLHIGVVSTNTGAQAGVSGCESNGDDGVLQNTPRAGGCTGPTDAFIRDIQEEDGRTINYTDTLEETFSCIAQLGTQGCAFESPLDAARRAVDPARNPGFIRADALLAVVFLTDEDDCSVLDRSMFDDPAGGVGGPLGPFSSFRCFDFGIRCNPDDPRSFGDKSECQVRDDSPYLESVTELAEFFRSFKGEGRFVTTAIFGQPEFSAGGSGFDATVVPNASSGQLSGTPDLGPVCTSNAGEAVPGIRMQAFLDEFPNSVGSSICDQTFALGPLGDQIADALSVRCIEPGNGAPNTCNVRRQAPNGEVAAVAECTGDSQFGCFEIASADDFCRGNAALRYRPTVDEPLGATVTFDCGAGL